MTCDTALKWCIKSKAKCIDDLSSAEMMAARLDQIKNAILQERNEALAWDAAVANQDAEKAGETDDEPIRTANPSKYAEFSHQYWAALASQTVKTYVKLCVEPSSENGIARAIEQAEINKSIGTEGKTCVLLLADLDLLAEAASRPGDRKPVLPDGLIQRLLRGSMQGRGAQRNSADECTVPKDGDCYFVTDGSREHLHKDILAAFTPQGKKNTPDANVKNVWMVVAEQSVRARKTLVRGDGINQKMQAYVISKMPISDMVPEKEFKSYGCTNRGNVISNISLAIPEAGWSMTVDTKRKLYGDRMIGSGDDKDMRSERKDDAIEPTFFHYLPDTFYRNLMHGMSATAVIDLTAGPGEAAKAALTLRKMYLGICLTERHMLELQKHLVAWTMDAMAKEGHQLYTPKYAEFKAKNSVDKDDADKKKTTKTDPVKNAKTDPVKKQKTEKSMKKHKHSSSSASPSPAKKKHKKHTPAISDSEPDSESN